MLLDGVEGNHELAGDGLIRPACRKHRQYLEFSVGQLLDQARHCLGTSPVIQPVTRPSRARCSRARQSRGTLAAAWLSRWIAIRRPRSAAIAGPSSAKTRT